MITVPSELKKEILRTDKKRFSLEKKFGYKPTSRIMSLDDITEFEVKVSKENLNNKDVSKEELFREYAVFFKRDDNFMGANKIKNHELKEYYNYRFDFNPDLLLDNEYSMMANINAKGDDLKNSIKEFSSKRFYRTFIINGHKYFYRYSSINALTNEVDDLYYYCFDENKTSDFGIVEKDLYKKKFYEIFRISAKTFEVNKLYAWTKKQDSTYGVLNFLDHSEVFYYFDNENTFEGVLATF